MQRLYIKREGDGDKGRTFEAILLAHVEADRLWDGGSTSPDAIRPVWMMVGGSESEVKAFTANLRCGKKAILGNATHYRRKEQEYEILRSAGYQVTFQKVTSGMVATLHLPELFRLDPGMVDPEGVRFCILPPAEWTRSQSFDPAVVTHVQALGFDKPAEEIVSMIPLAALFCAYLDRRTHCPLVSDMRFYLQIFLSALNQGIASWSTDPQAYYRDSPWGCHKHLGFKETDTSVVGLLPGVACMASHENLETFLAEQVDVYFQSISTEVSK